MVFCVVGLGLCGCGDTRDQAITRQHGARYALLAAMGLPPTVTIAIRPPLDEAAHLPPPDALQTLIDRALAGRPDVAADVARLRSAHEGVNAARAALKPRLDIGSYIEGYVGQAQTFGTARQAPPSSIFQPEGRAFLELSWPIYQGGSLRNQIRLAEAREGQARDTLAAQTLTAEQDVATSQDALTTARSQARSAMVLRISATTAYDAASEAYRHGVGTLTDASSATAALFNADADLASARAQVLTDALALAYATGQLAVAPPP